jgi:hypothetical protein
MDQEVVQPKAGIGIRRPNALPLSCAAQIDRERVRLLPDSKKAPISLAAQRRQIERLVGLHPKRRFLIA